MYNIYYGWIINLLGQQPKIRSFCQSDQKFGFLKCLRKFFPHNMKSNITFEIHNCIVEFPTIKIVNFTNVQSWAILPSKMAFESRGQNVTWHQSMTSVCVYIELATRYMYDVTYMFHDFSLWHLGDNIIAIISNHFKTTKNEKKQAVYFITLQKF